MPTVLVIGLDPYRVPGPWDPEPVAAALRRARDGFAAAGLDATECLVGLDGSDDVPAAVEAALRRGRWDCVVVGGGLRATDEQVEPVQLFEDVVNLVHRLAPAASIVFNPTVEDLVGPVRRRLAIADPDG